MRTDKKKVSISNNIRVYYIENNKKEKNKYNEINENLQMIEEYNKSMLYNNIELLYTINNLYNIL